MLTCAVLEHVRQPLLSLIAVKNRDLIGACMKAVQPLRRNLGTPANRARSGRDLARWGELGVDVSVDRDLLQVEEVDWRMGYSQIYALSLVMVIVSVVLGKGFRWLERIIIVGEVFLALPR